MPDSTEQAIEIAKLTSWSMGMSKELEYHLEMINDLKAANSLLQVESNNLRIDQATTEVKFDSLDCAAHCTYIDGIRKTLDTKANKNEVTLVKWLMAGVTILGIIATIIIALI